MADSRSEVFARIEAEAEAVGALQDFVKSWSAKFDVAAKLDAMKARGLTWEEVDLPFEQWMALKSEIARDSEGRVTA